MKHLWLIPKILRRASGAFALALLLPFTCALAQGTWTQKPDMPFYRNHNTGLAYNGKIYLFGGGADFTSCTNLVHEYNPATGSYTPKAPMPVGLCGTAAVETGGKIYLFGGYTTFAGPVTNAALEYDVANDKWKVLTPMPTTRGYASANLLPNLGNKIAVFGGGTAFAASALDIVELYDPATNSWSNGGVATGFGRGGHTAHYSGFANSIFIFGGVSSGTTPAEETVLVFDLIGGISIADSMQVRRVFHGSAAIGDKIFVMGGMDAMGGPVHASAEMFNMSSGQMSKIPVAAMPTARRAFATAAVDKKIYVFGGNDASVLKSVEVFDPGNLVAASEPFAASGAGLMQNTPNPFADETAISFSLTQSAQIDLSVFDLNGRKRATLVSQFLAPGVYTQHLNAGELESGIYYCRLLLDGFEPAVRKMVVVR